MVTSRLRQLAEPAVFVPEVARQRDEVVRAIVFGVLVIARASFGLDEITRKFVGCFDEDFSKQELVPLTVKVLALLCSSSR